MASIYISNAENEKSCNNMSLYIPYVESHISDEFLMEYFLKFDIGIVKRVDFIPKISNKGVYYHGAFLHFEKWFSNTLTKNIQRRLKNKELTTRMMYDEPKYWIVQENTSPAFNLVEEEERVLGSGYATGRKNQQINLDGLNQQRFELGRASGSLDSNLTGNLV